jgi:prolyl 4-hydroxylase
VLFGALTNRCTQNKNQNQKIKQGVGYTTINNWAVPTYTVDIYDKKLKGGGFELVKAVESMASQVIHEWTGVESEPTFVYGIRTYHNGSILMPHVDDLPRISSMIINIDQDVDEDWPLEVYGHDGKAYNVTTEPGEMVLYESHSILHGRPFPLKGRFYANIFIHFAPGKNMKTARQAVRIGDLQSMIAAISSDASTIHERDENGWQLLHEAARGGFEDLVEYLTQNGADVNSPTSYGQTALDIALGEHGEDHPVIQMLQVAAAKDNGAARYAARKGDYPLLISSLQIDHSSIHVRDGNGWQLIHEAVLGGSEEVVEFLVQNGADLNSPTYHHGAPLDIALEEYGEGHPIVKKLQDLGAFSSTDEESDEL